jgi:hypothetical protein
MEEGDRRVLYRMEVGKRAGRGDRRRGEGDLSREY